MLTALLAAAALLVWPHVRPVHRLLGPKERKFVVPLWLWSFLAVIGAFVAAGVGGIVAVTLLGVTVMRIHKRGQEKLARTAATEALSGGLGGVIDELRAGAHAACAAEGAAQDTPAPANEVLRAAAATARLGGDVERTLRGLDQPLIGTAVDQVARAWHVSAQHGVALADVLDATRRDLDQRTAFTRQVQARMAGPRASAAVLALLPVIGVLLGQLSGARPVHVLTGTTAGQFLLVLGAVFLAAGLWWTTRITEAQS